MELILAVYYILVSGQALKTAPGRFQGEEIIRDHDSGDRFRYPPADCERVMVRYDDPDGERSARRGVAAGR
jgi:hypothetical protein